VCLLGTIYLRGVLVARADLMREQKRQDNAEQVEHGNGHQDATSAANNALEDVEKVKLATFVKELSVGLLNRALGVTQARVAELAAADGRVNGVVEMVIGVEVPAAALEVLLIEVTLDTHCAVDGEEGLKEVGHPLVECRVVLHGQAGDTRDELNEEHEGHDNAVHDEHAMLVHHGGVQAKHRDEEQDDAKDDGDDGRRGCREGTN